MINRLAPMLLRKKLIALTFDDGPDEKTPAILDLLDEHGALATFFVLGRQVEGREDVLRRAVESGHELGNHTFDHPHIETLDAAEIEDQLSRASDAIEQAVGSRPKLMRPPYGLGALHAAPVARRLGMTTVLWSLNPKDWQEPNADQIAEAIVVGARPGTVVALHDGAARGGDRSATLAAVGRVLPLLADQDYSFVTVSALLERSPWVARTVVPHTRGPVKRVIRHGLAIAVRRPPIDAA